ncbi:hypothetical protein HAX54_052675 [Datura stramonium]|uniref:Uncharacterized protein n=1 Tax=Datura stramonium TaxID=4076 RepID=A0ABS8WSJ5_DATST|nr:hypothetical protein [Datura stramonium]
MNVLALQVAARQVIKETKVSPPQTNMDEETFGWEMEEEFLKETFASLFLSGEELDEVCQVSKRISTAKPRTTYMPPVSTSVPGCNSNIDVLPCETLSLISIRKMPTICRFEIRETYIGNSHWRPHRQLASSHRRWPNGDLPVGALMIEASTQFTSSYRRFISTQRSCLCLSSMGGQEVHTTPEAIHSLYWAEPLQPNSVFRRKVEDKVNQFQWVASIIAIDQPQWAISGRLHKTVWADGAITLDTKTDKDALALKQAKGTKNKTQLLPSMLSNKTEAQFQAVEVPASILIVLFKIAQMAQVHESQIVKLAKAIPSMIQQAIKKAMQPA